MRFGNPGYPIRHIHSSPVGCASAHHFDKHGIPKYTILLPQLNRQERQDPPSSPRRRGSHRAHRNTEKTASVLSVPQFIHFFSACKDSRCDHTPEPTPDLPSACPLATNRSPGILPVRVSSALICPPSVATPKRSMGILPMRFGVAWAARPCIPFSASPLCRTSCHQEHSSVSICAPSVAKQRNPGVSPLLLLIRVNPRSSTAPS
jgi:hypothetical protein